MNRPPPSGGNNTSRQCKKNRPSSDADRFSQFTADRYLTLSTSTPDEVASFPDVIGVSVGRFGWQRSARHSGSDSPTRFPTELLTTRWEMVPQNSQQLGEKAIFSKTKRYWRLQDKMGGNGLGNRCSIQLSYGTAKSFQSLAQVAFVLASQ